MSEGVVDPKDVVKVISATACETSEDWESLIVEYRRYFWKAEPDKAEALFREFLKEGRIVQPRLTENRRPTWLPGSPFVNSEDEIVWGEGDHFPYTLNDAVDFHRTGAAT